MSTRLTERKGAKGRQRERERVRETETDRGIWFFFRSGNKLEYSRINYNAQLKKETINIITICFIHIYARATIKKLNVTYHVFLLFSMAWVDKNDQILGSIRTNKKMLFTD